MKLRRRAPRVEFVQVANALVRDYRLSWRARGLLVELLSYPPGWEISVDDLVKRARRSGGRTEGRDAMRAAARELKSVGYIVETRHQDSQGRWSTELEVTDDPVWQMMMSDDSVSAGRTDDGFSVVGSPVVGSPVVGEPGVSMNTEKNTEENREEEDARARETSPPCGGAGAGGPAADAAASEGSGVVGERRQGASVWALEFVESLAREALTKEEGATAEELQEVAARLDAARAVVDTTEGLSWDELLGYLRQGWWDGQRRRFKKHAFVSVMRTRLSDAHIRSKALLWAREQRGSEVGGLSGARPERTPESDPFAGTAACSEHPHATRLPGGACGACRSEEIAADREGRASSGGGGQESAEVPEPPPLEELLAELRGDGESGTEAA